MGLRVAILSDTLSPTPTMGGHGLGSAVMFMLKQCITLGHHVTLFAGRGSVQQDQSYELVAPDDALPTREHEKVLARHALNFHRQHPFDVIIDCGHTHILSSLFVNLPIVNVYHDVWQPYERCPVLVSEAQRAIMAISDERFIQSRVLPNLVQRVNNIYNPHPSTPPYALFMAAILNYKQPILAIQSCAAFGIHLKIAGLFDDVLRSLISGRENITVLGAVDQKSKWDLLANASVFLNLGISESFGLTTVEANLCGTPVVGMPMGGTVDIIRYGENGVLVPPSSNQVQAVASSIERALEIPRHRVRLQALHHTTPPPSSPPPSQIESEIDMHFDAIHSLSKPLLDYQSRLTSILNDCANGLWW